jgi:hypothetical protein
MSENTKNSTQNGQNGQKNNNGSVGGNFEDVPILRLPFGMLMLSKDQETNGRPTKAQLVLSTVLKSQTGSECHTWT